jgi:hypothetical protein
MISGMWSNSNLDDGKSTREQALAEIEDNYQNVIESIYTGEFKKDEIPDHPLFTAMNLGGNS